MTSRLAILAVLIPLGCDRPASEPPAEPARSAPVKVKVIIVSPDGSTKEAATEIASHHLLGSYRLGDGTGYNLHLELKDSQRFECTWTGCLGVYGTSSGQWVLESDGPNLAVEQADGMLEDRPLGRLRVVSLQSHYLLLQERDGDWFAEHGPDTFRCFHQETARKVLEQQWLRRIREASK
jgi:hypothetical protein